MGKTKDDVLRSKIQRLNAEAVAAEAELERNEVERLVAGNGNPRKDDDDAADGSDSQAADKSMDAQADAQKHRPEPASVTLGKASGDYVEPGEEGAKPKSFTLMKWFILILVGLVFPILCRRFLPAPARCAMVILSVLLFNVFEVMPIYCTSLGIPVMCTLCQVLGNSRGTVETSTLVVGKFFNQVSFMVMGALVINGIFVKCRVERRFINLVLVGFDAAGSIFLLLLLLVGTAACSVLFGGSLLMTSALTPLFKDTGTNSMRPNVVKRLLLAVAYSSNAGSTWFPISSPVNLITISLLAEFDYNITLSSWVMVSIPVSLLAMLGTWLILVFFFPRPANPDDQHVRIYSGAHVKTSDGGDSEETDPPLTGQQWFFMLLAIVGVVVITVYATELEPIIGHAAIISLLLTVAAFGSGFMSEQEFKQLDWDLLAVVGGTNVLAFVVRETGLAVVVSTYLTTNPHFIALEFWTILAILVVCTVVISTASGHTLTGVLILPLVIAIGVKLQAAQTVAILMACAIPMGMGMPHSSFDNQLATSASKRLGRGDCVLNQRDFRISGGPLTVLAVVLLLTIGYDTCIDKYGNPPPMIISETGTSKRLRPKVATENTPSEVDHVQWNRDMANWDDFKDKPPHKAFAVGGLKPGKRSRAWSATWSHPSQESANRRAIFDCELQGTTCSLVFPANAPRPAEDPYDHYLLADVSQRPRLRSSKKPELEDRQLTPAK